MSSIQIAISIYRQDEQHLKQCIRSALSQTHTDLRITVRTDGPDSCTASALRWLRKQVSKNKKLHLVEGIKRIGIYGSYNSLFRQSSSRYLLQLDADDYLDPYALEILHEKINECPDAALSFGDCIEVDTCRRPIRLRGNPSLLMSNNLLNHFYCYHPRLIRRRCFERVGGYSSKYNLASDYDLCLRLDEIGSFLHVPLPLYYHRVHAKSATANGFHHLNRESLIAVQSALVRRGLHGKMSASLDTGSGAITLTHLAEMCRPFYIVPEESV